MCEMRYLPPNDTDINLVLSGALNGCPFCGGTPATINKINDETEIYRSVIACTKCSAQVGYNAEDLDKARRGATERWQARHS